MKRQLDGGALTCYRLKLPTEDKKVAAEGTVQIVTGTALRASDGRKLSYRWTFKEHTPQTGV